MFEWNVDNFSLIMVCQQTSQLIHHFSPLFTIFYHLCVYFTRNLLEKQPQNRIKSRFFEVGGKWVSCPIQVGYKMLWSALPGQSYLLFLTKSITYLTNYLHKKSPQPVTSWRLFIIYFYNYFLLLAVFPFGLLALVESNQKHYESKSNQTCC